MIPSSFGRISTGVASCVAFLLVAGSPAFAAPSQVVFEDVVAALGVGPQPSDYVISVDISGSMADEGRWQTVKDSLTAMADSLLPNDHVSLITFGKTSTLEFDGVVGQDPQQIVAALPPVPDGKASDIGLGISAGLDQLERPKANEVAAFVLITDGEHRADPNSPYDKVGSEGWQQLRTRADKLVAERPIAAYAVALKAGADAKLLREVFTDVTEVPANQVTEQFGRLDADLVAVQAAEVLRSDLGAGVAATWSRPLNDLGTSGTERVELTLTSNMKYVPIALSNLSVDAGAVQVSVTGLPAGLELNPGQSTTIPVELTWTGPGDGQLQVNAAISSPWQQVITDDLKLTFEPRITGGTPISAAAPIDLSGYVPYALLALVAGLIGFTAWWGYHITRPDLVGSISFSQNGELANEIILTGRRRKLDGIRTDSDSDGVVRGTVSGIRHKDAHGSYRTGVLINAQLGKDKVKAQLFDGDSLALGDLSITYTAVRSRMLALIES